jgi:hypothetical protein
MLRSATRAVSHGKLLATPAYPYLVSYAMVSIEDFPMRCVPSYLLGTRRMNASHKDQTRVYCFTTYHLVF